MAEEANEKLKQFLNEGRNWGRMATNIPGVFLFTLPASKGRPASLAIKINPVDTYGSITKKGMVAAKKSQDPNSPYSQIIQKMAASFEPMLENGSSAHVVAKVVLNAVTSENPSPRYLAGKDIETWMEAKRSMSDEEFYKMMKQNIMK
ncbi:MAG: hypothetical protein DLM72_12865 [Candidatus Nitrosopolaris wilkensis]|nr:MAG: hypothetical protein DLM72_12865 [Candidatus Nitrosopolaris wilkensis]